MTLSSSSNTYKKIFQDILGSYLMRIFKEFPDYCLKSRQAPYDIGRKYDEYKNMADKCLQSSKLDRHKLASCACGAIIAIQPIRYLSKDSTVKGANEALALYVGLAVMRRFMMYDFVEKLPTWDERQKVRSYLQSHFEVSLPELKDNIRDIQEYERNLCNALYWTYQKYDVQNPDPFQYDIWAYATIFYHLETYNKPKFDQVYKECCESNHLSA